MNTAILLIKIWTLSFTSFYLPTDRDAVVSVDTKDGIHCRASFSQTKKRFTMKCEKDLETVLYFEDKTPEIKTTIMVKGLMVKIGQ